MSALKVPSITAQLWARKPNLGKFSSGYFFSIKRQNTFEDFLGVVHVVLYMMVTMRMSLFYFTCLFVMIISCVRSTTFCPVDYPDYYDKSEGRTIRVKKTIQ